MGLNVGELENLDVSSIESMTEQQQIELANTMLQQQTGMDMGAGMQILGGLGIFLNLLYLIFFITTALGLYKISKKLGDKHSWLAFVPLIQVYTLIKTAGYTFWRGLIKLILLSILGWVVLVLIFTIMGFTINLLTPSSFMGGFVIGFIFGFIGMFVFVFIATYFLNAGIAKRTGQSTKTATLMTLFPWCMYLIVAKRMGDNFAPVENNDSVKISQDAVSTEEL